LGGPFGIKRGIGESIFGEKGEEREKGKNNFFGARGGAERHENSQRGEGDSHTSWGRGAVSPIMG